MEQEKLYYSIHEVAERLGVTPVTLRYWESQFKELKPARGGRSMRHYSQSDIELLQRIYRLTKECGFTIEGTRAQLQSDKLDIKKEKVIADLKEVRQFLVDLKELL